MKSLIFLMLFLTGSFSSATINWEGLAAQVIKNGKSNSFQFGETKHEAKYLEKIEGDEDKSHIASYITVFGATDNLGKFHAFLLGLNQEKWELQADGKSWLIDQWLITIYPNGKTDVTHSLLSKNELSHVTFLPTAPVTNEEAQVVIQSILSKIVK